MKQSRIVVVLFILLIILLYLIKHYLRIDFSYLSTDSFVISNVSFDDGILSFSISTTRSDQAITGISYHLDKDIIYISIQSTSVLFGALPTGATIVTISLPSEYRYELYKEGTWIGDKELVWKSDG